MSDVTYETVFNGMIDFFEGEHFIPGKVVDESSVKGQPQHDCNEYEPFDKVFVEQGGGGITGDDFHGTVYFHIGGGRYATAEY
jgi:hypothetical protein